MAPQAYFSPCPRGLEPVLAEELRRCGAAGIRPVPGGAGFEGDLALCHRVNLGSRFATRVLLRIGRTAYRNEQDVYNAAHALHWPEWFEVSRSIRVDVTAIRSPLRSLDFITLRIKDAVCDRFREECGRRPDVDRRSPEVRIAAFLDASEVTFYLDTSGEPLYKRGYRKQFGEAPLKENLAAGIVALTGWTPEEPLFDPMCGSGTFLIEAAMMALRLPPGAKRQFGFERLKNHDARLWRSVRESLPARPETPRALPIFGSDVSDRELARVRENLAAAGLEGRVELKHGNVLDLSPPAGHGVIVANPPYGVRLGEDRKLAAFYPKLGDALKAKFAGWRCYIFSADPRLPKLIRLKATRRTPLFNGSLECRLYEYRIVAGSNREHPRAGMPA